jgi:hypothetical protein
LPPPGADQRHAPADPLLKFGGGEIPADRRSADDVVAACVADSGEGVVLGEHADVRALGAMRGDQRGLQAADPDLGGVAVSLQQLRHRPHGPVLGVPLLRVGVQVLAERDELVAALPRRGEHGRPDLLRSTFVLGDDRLRVPDGALGGGVERAKVAVVGRRRPRRIWLAHDQHPSSGTGSAPWLWNISGRLCT